MKIDWKAKLKTVLSVAEISDDSTKQALTKADITDESLVSSVIVSDDLVDSPKTIEDLEALKSGYFHTQLNRFIEMGIKFQVTEDNFIILDDQQNLKISDMEFLKLNREAIFCQFQQSLLMKHIFSHSPERFEDFAFEVYERESLLTKPGKTPIGIYCEAVKDVTKRWFSELLKTK